MARAAWRSRLSQRHRTRIISPDRLQPDRRSLHCGTHSVGVTSGNRELGGRWSIHRGPLEPAGTPGGPHRRRVGPNAYEVGATGSEWVAKLYLVQPVRRGAGGVWIITRTASLAGSYQAWQILSDGSIAAREALIEEASVLV